MSIHLPDAHTTEDIRSAAATVLQEAAPEDRDLTLIVLTELVWHLTDKDRRVIRKVLDGSANDLQKQITRLQAAADTDRRVTEDRPDLLDALQQSITRARDRS